MNGQNLDPRTYYLRASTTFTPNVKYLIMIQNEKDKCLVTLPESKNDSYYMHRLAHLIIAKFTGVGLVLADGNQIHFEATKIERIKIQALIDTCGEELEELIGHMVYSLLRRKNLLPPSEIELIMKKTA